MDLKAAPLTHDAKGAKFSITGDGQSPTIHSNKYLFFGEVEVVCRAAPGKGIVTSVVLQSDDLDEIDWEWIGVEPNQVQTNYFSKGDTKTYDRGGKHTVSAATTTYHTYTIRWTSQALTWSIDGTAVRTLSYADAHGGKSYPQTPMQLKLGTWTAGGSKSSQGTADWAGGRTDFKQAPFDAYYKSIKITDFAGGDKPASGGVKQYVYSDTDKSGSWQSIRVDMGESKADSKHAENGVGDGKDNGSSSRVESKDVVDQNMTRSPANGTSSSSSSSSTMSAPTSLSTSTRPSNDSITDGPPAKGADRTISGNASGTGSASGNNKDSSVPSSAAAPGLVACGPLVLALAAAQFLL
ncbi:hypothetical protein CDD80_3625 [Ophiocordyceps camponoti-rufipedis]|uniref:GH16 domain-containing protein n=1 Tax=Ophiocordyceps camponoti-rufipedis TaxID=2004952 RepID=A0A2C5Z233_9HYPO|nr:hypothetical protein CDD80_3625 [Ophiocordyceps camponoti-rufipedis]